MSWAGCIGLNSKVSILIQSRVYARSPVPELKGDCEKRVDIAIKSRLVEQVELLGCPVRSRGRSVSLKELYLSRGILHYDDRTRTQVTILASYTGSM